jgi:T5SS/PEP-CTERM-associated repeat protein
MINLQKLSRLTAFATLAAIPGVNVFGTTGGSGTSTDPYVVDARDFDMDRGHYRIDGNVDFVSGKFVKLGLANKNNFLSLRSGVSVTASFFLVGDGVGSGAEVSVPDADFRAEMLVVGRKGEGVLNQTGGTVRCVQLLIGAETGGKGVFRLSGNGSLLEAERFITCAQQGSGSLEVAGGALAVTGRASESGESYLSGVDGAIRLNGGSFAVQGDILTGANVATLDATYHFERRRSRQWRPVSIADLRATYIDGVVNRWTASPLYSAFGDRIDLTGFTVVTTDADHAWADAAPSDVEGWYHSPWFGWFFNDETMAGWTFSFQHGFVYVHDVSTADAVYLWDSSARCWWYTSARDYPWMYDYRDGTWCRYDSGNYPHRRFYDSRRGASVDEAELSWAE